MKHLRLFNHFVALNENVQQAKSYLTKKGIPLDDPAYQTIRTILEKTPGWVAAFVRFHYEERVGLGELAELYDMLTKMGTALKQLPKPVDQYEKLEQLSDDIDKVAWEIKVRKLYQELPAALKQEYNDPDFRMVRNTFRRLAVPFSALDPAAQTAWTRKISSFKSLMALVTDLEIFIETGNSEWSFAHVRQDVEKTPGASVVFENEAKGVLVAQLFTYNASEALNGATQWCIRNSESNWESYVDPIKGNRQYTIYNFNVPSSDPESMVGVTVGLMGDVYASHRKDDTELTAAEVRSYLKKWGVPRFAGSPKPVNELAQEVFEKIMAQEDGRRHWSVINMLGRDKESTGSVLFKTTLLTLFMDELAGRERYREMDGTIYRYFRKNAMVLNPAIAAQRKELYKLCMLAGTCYASGAPRAVFQSQIYANIYPEHSAQELAPIAKDLDYYDVGRRQSIPFLFEQGNKAKMKQDMAFLAQQGLVKLTIPKVRKPL